MSASNDGNTGWIAADWGTTRLRAWVMNGAQPVEYLQCDLGMGALAPHQFEPALIDLVGGWLNPEGTTPVVACGIT